MFDTHYLPTVGHSLDRVLIEELEKVVGKDDVVTAIAKMQNYLVDESPASVRPRPANDLVLVKPADAQQVSAVLRLANNNRIPVFPRGGGTGLVGGAIPTRSGSGTQRMPSFRYW